ncbi:hypothetical protein E1301_Tti015941 [Triplophysa tibetana]|uniref:Uncharacterized protein n=1 Tax=Triplophysa tibetana TaxID=1572043 RepID=A0A5A9PAH9_9TELE|nr:hypothetical protein E1301_Tti015941 [Triplophysa tibetana]
MLPNTHTYFLLVCLDSEAFASEHPFALASVGVFRCAFARQGARRATPPVSRIRKRSDLPSLISFLKVPDSALVFNFSIIKSRREKPPNQIPAVLRQLTDSRSLGETLEVVIKQSDEWLAGEYLTLKTFTIRVVKELSRYKELGDRLQKRVVMMTVLFVYEVDENFERLTCTSGLFFPFR